MAFGPGVGSLTDRPTLSDGTTRPHPPRISRLIGYQPTTHAYRISPPWESPARDSNSLLAVRTIRYLESPLQLTPGFEPRFSIRRIWLRNLTSFVVGIHIRRWSPTKCFITIRD